MSNTRVFSSVMQDINSLYLPSNERQVQSFKVAFVLLENFSMMSFTAAIDVLITANLVSGETLFEVSSYALKSNRVISDLGIEIATNGELSLLKLEESSTIDLLIICGGLRCSFQPHPPLTKLLKQAHAWQVTLGSIWNGAIALAQAKVIDHQTCALHIDNHALFQEQFPTLKLSRHHYQIEPLLISCSDANGALEMMLKLVGNKYSAPICRAVQAILKANRSASNSQQNPLQYDQQTPLPPLLHSAIQLMNANIEEPLVILDIAVLLSTNRRQLERLFKQHLATSPSRHYLEIRLTYARRLLVQSDDSITNIAIASGFVSSNHFSHCFSQFFQMPPSHCRSRIKA